MDRIKTAVSFAFFTFGLCFCVLAIPAWIFFAISEWIDKSNYQGGAS